MVKMKNLFLLSWIVMSGTFTAVQCQSASVAGAQVSLEAICRRGDEYKMSLMNGTQRAISVGTGSLYAADIRRYKEYKLADGSGSVLVLNDKQEIPNLFYSVLREKTDKRGTYLSVISMSGHTGADSWIAPGQSVSVGVPVQYANAPSTIYIRFRYEWELKANGTFSNGYLEHRIYNSYFEPAKIPKCTP